MATQVYDNSFRTTMICIDAYDDKILRGRMYNNALEKGIEFVGTIDFLQNMEKLLEQINYPQAFMSKRTFGAATGHLWSPPTCENVKVGRVGTFSLRLLFRQNASWQGTLLWHEGQQEESFRSVLEMLLLMDSALSSQK